MLERSTNQCFTGTNKLGNPIRVQVFSNLWLIFNGGIIFLRSQLKGGDLKLYLIIIYAHNEIFNKSTINTMNANKYFIPNYIFTPV